MAYGHLQHLGHGAQKIGQVVAVEVVAGIDAQACVQGGLASPHKALQHLAALGVAPGAGVALGVELHAVGAPGANSRHGGRIGVHEEAHAHAQRTQLSHDGGQALGVLRKAPAVVAGELVLAVGHQGALLWPQLAHQVHEVVKGVALDVELALRPLPHQARDVLRVLRADVALVGPRVDGDALGARLQAQLGRAQRAGQGQVAAVAQQRHFVDIDRQRCTGGGV